MRTPFAELSVRDRIGAARPVPYNSYDFYDEVVTASSDPWEIDLMLFWATAEPPTRGVQYIHGVSVACVRPPDTKTVLRQPSTPGVYQESPKKSDEDEAEEEKLAVAEQLRFGVEFVDNVEHNFEECSYVLYCSTLTPAMPFTLAFQVVRCVC